MNYSQINKFDVANGSGVRVSIFTTGCAGFESGQHCEGCFNSEIWDFKSGKLFDSNVKDELFDYLSNPHIKGLSVLGGEPLQQGEELLDLLKEVREVFPHKDIWLWTGYYIDGRDHLNAIQRQTLSLCDYVVDGRFIEAQKDVTLRFRGSLNQTIWERNKETNEFVKSQLNNNDIK